MWRQCNGDENICTPQPLKSHFQTFMTVSLSLNSPQENCSDLRRYGCDKPTGDIRGGDAEGVPRHAARSRASPIDAPPSRRSTESSCSRRRSSSWQTGGGTAAVWSHPHSAGEHFNDFQDVSGALAVPRSEEVGQLQLFIFQTCNQLT